MEVLSQSQIDDLLKTLTRGAADLTEAEEVGTKKIKEYDFRTPKRFTKDNMRIISSVYENYSRLLASYLTSMLRLYVEAECVYIEEQRYSEFNNALPDSIMAGMGEISFPDAEGENISMVMDVAKPIAYAIVERLLGGSGSGFGVDKDFTEIELSLLDGVLKGAYPQMTNSWANHYALDIVYRRIETNSRLIQSISPDDSVVIVMLDVKVRDISGNINICIPASCLERIFRKLDSLNARNMRRVDASGDEERREIVMKYLHESSLEMSCVVGKTEVTLGDIYYLSVGDVIQLDKPLDSQVELNIGESCWFKGKMGVKKGKKAVQVKEVL